MTKLEEKICSYSYLRNIELYFFTKVDKFTSCVWMKVWSLVLEEEKLRALKII
jgi:hypothetical protein